MNKREKKIEDTWISAFMNPVSYLILFSFHWFVTFVLTSVGSIAFFGVIFLGLFEEPFSIGFVVFCLITSLVTSFSLTLKMNL